ncbi:enoyl-CoA hydratase/isomerase family protein [Aureispira anguillae]|uniref:Enoyl-CoA hydratase-related protein n=1 Tax=Aureispira anguillae TaxID=2864201 RepID=A0A915YHY8_9BACT|nr:enoyl-CoA hydratase-related protein [Aureispira anguillae]BDS13535.1 enoyl-CoA hydratase-related protein [Aureispira anguillae]
MEYKNLLTTYKDGILVVTINRPKALNALNKQTLSDLRQLFEKDALNLEGLRGVVLTGAGEKAFVAGADITEFNGLDAQGGLDMAQNGHDIFFSIERFHVPVIAAVGGYALGGGCELAMACHIRVASDKALFGQPEVNLGLIPGYGGTQRLIQYIGKGRALELLMTADMIDAQKALDWGLANHVVPHGEEIEKAIEILKKIAKKAPLAISKTIATVNAYFDKEHDGFKQEVLQFAQTVKTEDFKEGAAAFLEKRKAVFQGK